VIGLRPRIALDLLSSKAGNEPARGRDVWFEGGWRKTPVYQRESLPPRFEGPAIIEQLDCTTVLEPGNRAEVDPLGNLVVTV
jgi:N-methylhydantoinase A